MTILDDALVGGNDAPIDLHRRVRSRRSTALMPEKIKKKPGPKERKDGATKDSASEDLGGPSSRSDSSLDGICSRYRRLSEQCPTIAKEFAIDHVIVQSAQGVSVAELAKQFQRTERTIYNWLSKGRDRLAEAFRQSHSDQIAQIIGRDISLFEMRMRLGFALATNANATPNEVAKGLRIAETAHQGLIDFRSKLGFYDHRPLANSLNDDADGQSSDNDFLADCAENIVNAVFAASQRCDEQDDTG